MGKEIHVSVNGNDNDKGNEKEPFLTISKAAKIAQAGDRIIVHEGVYREWVNPTQGGKSDYHRISYEAANGEHVTIKGSERIQNWEKEEGSVWKVTLPNAFFGDFNPYCTVLEGDWLLYPQEKTLHLGDVYLNGMSFFEVDDLEEVKNPQVREIGYHPAWTQHEEKILHPENTKYVWYAEVDSDKTTIYANFHTYDPNQEMVEINVRPYCFYPDKTGINYITVKGFEMAQAACPWAPPTADQPGLIGTHWSRGWIIEENTIHDAKCSAVSIGKEYSTGHNLHTKTHLKPGYQYQLESVFLALQKGWSKETIGSHVIRNNMIYDCGQNGIVGHMGCAFSQIYGNQIYNIGVKHEFFGYEIAGIKLHAAIDTQIFQNNIHDCTLGLWLDWQAQGTRVSRNLFYRNNRDLMMEVTHGPSVVDHNIFASEYNWDNQAQGTAFLHNLCCGVICLNYDPNRSTPYHVPHATQVAGCAVVYGGDDRIMQNIFVGNAPKYTENAYCGTCGYDGAPSSLKEYLQQIEAGGIEDMGPFLHTKQPVYIQGNCYLEGALPYEKEEENYRTTEKANVEIEEYDGKVVLKMDGLEAFFENQTRILSSKELGLVRIVEAPYETPQGEMLYFDTDYFGKKRKETPVAGPFEEIVSGRNVIEIWK